MVGAIKYCRYGMCRSDSRPCQPGFEPGTKFFRFPKPCLQFRKSSLSKYRGLATANPADAPPNFIKNHIKKCKEYQLKIIALPLIIMKRSEKKPLGCGICSYKTNSACHLERHLRIHTGHKPYACMTCNYRATDGGLLKRHMRVHSGEKPFICQICGHKTAQSCSLKDHMAVHTGKKRYSCEICTFQCSRIGRLREHQLQHKDNDSTPKSNVPTFSSDVGSHDAAGNSILRKCTYCCLEFSEMTTLNQHLLTVHPTTLSHKRLKGLPTNKTTEAPYRCAFCSITKESLEEFENHVSCHLLYKCLNCESVFETAGELTSHGTSHSDNIFKCSFCDFDCKTRNELRGHERTHSNNQQFKCSSCNFVSKSLVEFSQHMITHSSKEMVQCNICLFKFSNTEELRGHMTIHYTRTKTRSMGRSKPNIVLDPEELGIIGYYSCFYCSYKSSDERVVERHILDKHVVSSTHESGQCIHFGEKVTVTDTLKSRKNSSNAVATSTSPVAARRIDISDFFTSPQTLINKPKTPFFSSFHRIIRQPLPRRDHEDGYPHIIREDLEKLLKYGCLNFSQLHDYLNGSVGKLTLHHSFNILGTDCSEEEENRLTKLENQSTLTSIMPGGFSENSRLNNFAVRLSYHINLQRNFGHQGHKSNCSIIKEFLEFNTVHNIVDRVMYRTKEHGDNGFMLKKDIDGSNINETTQVDGSSSNISSDSTELSHDHRDLNSTVSRSITEETQNVSRKRRRNNLMGNELPIPKILKMKNNNKFVCVGHTDSSSVSQIRRTNHKSKNLKCYGNSITVGTKHNVMSGSHSPKPIEVENSIQGPIIDKSGSFGAELLPSTEGTLSLTKENEKNIIEDKYDNNMVLSNPSKSKYIQTVIDPTTQSVGQTNVTDINDGEGQEFTNEEPSRSRQLGEQSVHSSSVDDSSIHVTPKPHHHFKFQPPSDDNFPRVSIHLDSGDLLLSKMRTFFKDTLPTFDNSYGSKSTSPTTEVFNTNPSATIHTIDLGSDCSSDD